MAVLFNGAEPFKQIVKTTSIESPMWNLVKIGHLGTEKTMFKYYTILYLYNAQGQ